jgi:hypothetical protein
MRGHSPAKWAGNINVIRIACKMALGAVVLDCDATLILLTHLAGILQSIFSGVAQQTRPKS